MIEAGERLMEALDRQGEIVDAGLWFYYSEEGTWKLLVSMPARLAGGPKSAYRSIQRALKKSDTDALNVEAIQIIRSSARVLRLLRKSVVLEGMSGVRFRQNVIGGQYVEDAYIYRLQSNA